MTFGGMLLGSSIPFWITEQAGHGNMRRLNLFFFYRFGWFMGRFQEVTFSENSLAHWKLSGVLKDVDEWLGNIGNPEWTDFPKTSEAARELRQHLSPFTNDIGKERVIKHEEWTSILNSVMHFTNVFGQELNDNFAYLVTPIGAYSVPLLLGNAEHHLSELAQGKISEATKNDFQMAGICLLVDLYTASGFHAMRALESEARKYHKIVTGLELNDSPLGALINGDTRVRNSGLKPRFEKMGSQNDDPLGLIISMLSHINKIYRCPVMHPEMTLDKETAKQVFDISAIAISSIVADSQRLKAKQQHPVIHEENFDASPQDT